MNHSKNRLQNWLAKIMEYRPSRFLLRLGVIFFAPKHRVGVNLVCFDPDGRVLLLYHVFHPGIPWGLPGGWLSPGETPEQCALRELFEETGVQATLVRPLLIERNRWASHLEIVYQASIDGEAAATAHPRSGEISGLAWFDPHELPARLTRTTRKALAAAFVDQAPFPA